MVQVTTVAQAIEAAEHAVDVIIAQGSEAGGYGGAISTMALVPQVVDAVSPTPVVAAGGIYNRRGIAAAFSWERSGSTSVRASSPPKKRPSTMTGSRRSSKPTPRTR